MIPHLIIKSDATQPVQLETHRPCLYILHSTLPTRATQRTDNKMWTGCSHEMKTRKSGQVAMMMMMMILRTPREKQQGEQEKKTASPTSHPPTSTAYTAVRQHDAVVHKLPSQHQHHLLRDRAHHLHHLHPLVTRASYTLDASPAVASRLHATAQSPSPCCHGHVVTVCHVVMLSCTEPHAQAEGTC